MNIVELFARIGIKTDEGKLKDFEKRVKTVKTGLLLTTGAAAGVSLAIRKITADAMNSAVAFKQFEAETGASAQTLQKWQSVAEQTNQSAQVVDSAVKAIVANQEKIKLGQGNISGYQLLGIDPNQDPFEILEELRTKTTGLTEGMKKNVLAQMGIGAGLVQTLALTRDQFDAMASKSFIIDPRAIDTLTKLKSTMDLSSRGIKYMKAQIAVGLAPQITALSKKFNEFMKVNEKSIVKGFREAFNMVKIFTGAVIGAANMLNRIIVNTVGWERTVKGLLVVIAALNASLLMSPIGLFTAAVILLVAVLDDLAVYSRGGKSLFGKMVEKVPELGVVFEKTFGFVTKLLELIQAFATGDDLKIDSILDQWGKWGDIIKGIVDGFETLAKIDLSKENVEEAVSTIGVEKGLSFGERSKKAWENTMNFIPTMLGLREPESASPGNISVTVNGASNPEDTATAVERVLQRVFNGASAHRSRNE